MIVRSVWNKFRFLKPAEGESDAGGGGKGEKPVEKKTEPVDVAALERLIQEADDEELDKIVETQHDKGEAGAEAEAQRATEREALSKGWTPKDKFKGPADKWVDAKTFVERGKRFNVNLQNEVVSLKRQLEEFKGTAEAFKKFHKQVVADKEAEIVEAKSELKRRLREAVREGDDDLADRIEGRMEALDEAAVNLKKEAEAVPKEDAQATEKVRVEKNLNEWIADGNEWFKTDAKMRGYAIAIGDRLRSEGSTLKDREFLDAVRQELEEDFPSKFGKKTPESRRSIVDSGGAHSGGEGKTTKTIKDLPSEDRKLCLQFVKEGWTTEADFLKSYFSRNPG